MERASRTAEAVLFDLDGTLVDSREDIAASLNAALVAVGAAPRPSGELVGWIGEPLAAIFEGSLPAELSHRVQDACAAYRSHYFDHCADRSALYPGVLACLDALAGRSLAVATTKATFQAVRVCEAFGIASRFAAIQGCDGIPHKPDPAVVRAALARLGVAPEAAWMVGDTGARSARGPRRRLPRLRRHVRHRRAGSARGRAARPPPRRSHRAAGALGGYWELKVVA
jgi:phosphoglycolate phosphatase